MTDVQTYQRDGVTLYHADCRVVLPMLAGRGVTALLTDPPHRGTHYTDHRELANETDEPNELVAWQADQARWTRQWLPATLRLIRPSALAWIFCSPFYLPVLSAVLYGLPWPLRRIWMRPECFGLLLLTDRILTYDICGRIAWQLLVEPYRPPAMAPSILDLVLDLYGPDEVILDPFAGAGAGFLIAARRHNLRCVGVEHDPQAFEAAVAALEAV